MSEILPSVPFNPPSAQLFEMLAEFERSSQDILRIADITHCAMPCDLTDRQVEQLLDRGER